MYTALVIDDNLNTVTLFRELIGFLLRESGIHESKILTAQSGEEGFDLAYGNSVDILFADYNLPGINGFGLIRLLRTGVRNTKMVLMSSDHDLLGRFSRRIDLEIDAILKKPVNRSELKKLVLSSLACVKGSRSTEEQG
ncbi:MAG: response regulator (plasmid) [Candidatus Manganitrophus sp.]|nr:response regulator [Candidatus Manganitrophus sp.]MDC4228149.1 response regulator [Candidatus Manganitrophus sp.]WDT73600.1 MAG: response regulator [Candidatus Manganitrophus sp.]WDT82897.1 MAG: response regulator [Candidatus Manganitrophus sp.]